MRIWLASGAVVVALSLGAFAAPNPKVTSLGKGKHVHTPQGDHLIVRPVTLDDGTTVDVLGGTVDGVTMEAPDDQPPLTIGQRVKKEKHGSRWRLVPEDSQESWFGVPVAHAYTYGGHRWKDNTLRYYVNTTNPVPPATISPAQQDAALAAAVQRWVDQTGANLTVVSAGLTTNNTVAGNYHSDVFWREGPSEVAGRVAATYFYWGGDGYLFDADMITYKGWGTFYPLTNCTAGSFRAFADEVWTHEFGHFAGFGHSTFTTATMWPSIPASCSGAWRSLDPDDIAAARAAYGTTAIPPPAVPVLFTPTDASVPPDVYLRWYASTGATSYDIYAGIGAATYLGSVTPPNCTCVSGAYPGTLYRLRPTSAGTYTWRIVAKNAAGATASATWTYVAP